MDLLRHLTVKNNFPQMQMIFKEYRCGIEIKPHFVGQKKFIPNIYLYNFFFKFISLVTSHWLRMLHQRSQSNYLQVIRSVQIFIYIFFYKKCIVYFSLGLPNLPELTMDPDLQAIQQMQQQIASPQPPPRSAKISMDTQGDAANDLASANNPGSLAGASSRLPNGQPPRAIQSTT